MAAFKRPGELSASAFGLSFADRDVGCAAQAPIYNKNERLALAEQVGGFCLCRLNQAASVPACLLHRELATLGDLHEAQQAAHQALPTLSCFIAALTSAAAPPPIPGSTRSAAGCPSMRTARSCCTWWRPMQPRWWWERPAAARPRSCRSTCTKQVRALLCLLLYCCADEQAGRAARVRTPFSCSTRLPS